MKQTPDGVGTEAPSPLNSARARLARALQEDGYRQSSTEQYLSICRKFDDFVARRHLSAGQLREEHLEQFLLEASAHRKLRQGGRLLRRFYRKPLLLLLEHLREDGWSPADAAPPELLGPGLAEYLAFLREHRGLSQRTITRHQLYLSRFLAHLQVHTEQALGHLCLEQVDRYLIHASRQLARESIGGVCAALRGFLGHLHLRGVLPVALHPQVATPHIYPLAAMPRAVAWTEIERTLATVDRSTPRGCRDYAILTLIAYGGLRAGDVAALHLSDFDWRRDTLHVRRTKGKWSDELPLIPLLGEAVIAYLRRRPETTHQKVFLTDKAPLQPIRDVRISAMARHYLQRAGVNAAKLGSHTLRHSFAVELLRKGHSLKTIGEMLGHAHPQSTFLYTKAAVEDLRTVALGLEEVQP